MRSRLTPDRVYELFATATGDHNEAMKQKAHAIIAEMNNARDRESGTTSN